MARPAQVAFQASGRVLRKGQRAVADVEPTGVTPSSNGDYNADSISVLEGLEAVRKRPGMYIGSTGERGLHHLVTEVVDNSIDEAMAGFADTVEITLLADGGVQVIDNGRGIPVDINTKTGKPALELVLTVLHAGGKFGDGGYQVSGGLHGVGVSVVNAVSTNLNAVVRRDGHTWSQNYVMGVPKAPLAKGGEATETGTMITFWADPDIFETTVYSFETLSRRFQEMAFLNKGLTISLTDERPEFKDENGELRSVKYHYPAGIADFMRHINARKGQPTHPDVIDFEGEAKEKKVAAQIALQWNSQHSESIYAFANGIHTHGGGTHEEGFRAAMTTLVNKYARDTKLLREKDENLAGEDIREGLTAIISVKLVDPQFEGQTKDKLGNTEVKTFVQRLTYEKLGEWLEENPNEARDIIKKSVQASTARMAARKAREL